MKSNKVLSLLNGEMQNNIFPFFWVHGEDHDVYRATMKAVYDSNVRAICVEARPHPKFVQQQWWEDLEVILSEAEKYGMKVWILDDEHFPTGYAEGAVKQAPLELQKWNICHRSIQAKKRSIKLNIDKLKAPDNRYNMGEKVALLFANNWRFPKKTQDDQLLSVTAYRNNEYKDLGQYINKGMLEWTVDEEGWTIHICSLSRNTGMRRNYINLLEDRSCQIQIDAVYKPHYERFRERFGNTIAGFFSDEPELGNGSYIRHYNVLGTHQSLPFSITLSKKLEEALGKDWKQLMPLLWENGFDKKLTAKVRYIYMDCVTRLVENNFSKKLGTWCNDHGVEYIGHVIEDNGQHARTSTSLGHYFRGLKYQNMAGVDIVTNQLVPDNFDKKEYFMKVLPNDGEFYHFELGKLGASLASINPRMEGRAMCEMFGNYGWGESMRLMKYIADHFMVRGTNRFVPHAFSNKAYPDKDCPPHFYAHGHNPLYRSFGYLMSYMGRVSTLISDGKIDVNVAVLYSAEAEWCGESMPNQKVCRVLLENQIDFNIIPSDVFSERDFYNTKLSKQLIVNDNKHNVLIVPYSQYITQELSDAVSELSKKGFSTLFINALPDAVCTKASLSDAVLQSEVVQLEQLADKLNKMGLKKALLSPSNARIRVMHYLGSPSIYYIFNEGTEHYLGTLTIDKLASPYIYDAWNNECCKLDYTTEGNNMHIQLNLHPTESLLLVYGDSERRDLKDKLNTKDIKGEKIPLTNFTRSVCKSIDYPNFTKHESIDSLESYSLKDRKFSGFIRYETSFTISEKKSTVLEIIQADDVVENWVNKQHVGVQIIPPFVFDISNHCISGENELVIEVATTLERERGNTKKAAPTGITGDVFVYIE